MGSEVYLRFSFEPKDDTGNRGASQADLILLAVPSHPHRGVTNLPLHRRGKRHVVKLPAEKDAGERPPH